MTQVGIVVMIGNINILYYGNGIDASNKKIYHTYRVETKSI